MARMPQAWVQNNFGRALLLPSREANINSRGAAVQHNFRRTLLLPSRKENINSLGVAVQHNFRRALLVPSRVENIKRMSIAWAPRYSQASSKAKITGCKIIYNEVHKAGQQRWRAF